MSNSYKYIDPDYTYTDPVTGLLKNVLDITDLDVLHFIESGAVAKRLQELYVNPIKIRGIAFLQFTNAYFKIFMFGLERNVLLK